MTITAIIPARLESSRFPAKVLKPICDLPIVEHVRRRALLSNCFEEVIVATSATVEGQTTAFYIEDKLKETNVKITKLAQGLPVGGEIESLDDGTLHSAFKNRTTI